MCHDTKSRFILWLSPTTTIIKPKSNCRGKWHHTESVEPRLISHWQPAINIIATANTCKEARNKKRELNQMNALIYFIVKWKIAYYRYCLCQALAEASTRARSLEMLK
jgi:hypothetical protein